MQGVNRTSRVRRGAARAVAVAAISGAVAAMLWLALGFGGSVGAYLAPMRGAAVLIAGLAVLLVLGRRGQDSDGRAANDTARRDIGGTRVELLDSVA